MGVISVVCVNTSISGEGHHGWDTHHDLDLLLHVHPDRVILERYSLETMLRVALLAPSSLLLGARARGIDGGVRGGEVDVGIPAL